MAYAVLGGSPDQPLYGVENSLTLRGLAAVKFFTLLLLATERSDTRVVV
jgi:hypothetical protein